MAAPAIGRAPPGGAADWGIEPSSEYANLGQSEPTMECVQYRQGVGYGIARAARRNREDLDISRRVGPGRPSTGKIAIAQPYRQDDGRRPDEGDHEDRRTAHRLFGGKNGCGAVLCHDVRRNQLDHC